jgi:hypothetical protein
MAVDFLDIVPQERETATVQVIGQDGEQEVTVFAIDRADLAWLARNKCPGVRSLFGSEDSVEDALGFAEGQAFITAAGLVGSDAMMGKDFDKYVAAVRRMPASEKRKLFRAVWELAFGKADEEDERPPAAPGAAPLAPEGTADHGTTAT